MKRLIILAAFIFAAIFAFTAFTNNPPVKAYDFTLPDYNGDMYTLSDYSDSEIIVVMFIATQCPVSNNYNSRMAELYNDYKDKGVTFLGINSNKQESVEEIRRHAKKNGLEFPILKDDKNKVADEYEASVTPEVYAMDGDLEIFYHGRIDDSQRINDVSVHDLRTAIEQKLAGKEVTKSETKAFGCSIKRI